MTRKTKAVIGQFSCRVDSLILMANLLSVMSIHETNGKVDLSADGSNESFSSLKLQKVERKMRRTYWT